MTFHDYFSNRDVAVVMWVSIAIAVAIARVPDFRRQVPGLLKLFFSPKILGPLVLLICAASALAYGAERLGVWNLTYIVPTVGWFGAFVFTSYFKMNEELLEKNYLLLLAKRVLKSVVPLELYVSITDFPLIAEFFLVPIATALVLLAWYVVEYPQPGWEPTAKLLNGLVIALGSFVIARTTWLIASDPSSFDVRHQVGLLAMPIWLGLFMVPLLGVLRWWMAIDSAFVQVNIEADRMSSRGEESTSGAKRRAKLVLLVRSLFKTARLPGIQRSQLISMLQPASLKAAWEASALR